MASFDVSCLDPLHSSMLFESQVIQAAATEPKAFSKLYRHYLKSTYAFIAFRVNRIADAEDLTSDLWIKVLERLPSLQSNKPEVFRAWIYTMARNLVIDFYRKKNPTLSLNEDIEISDEAKLDDFLFETSSILKLVKTLPKQQAEVVSLKYFSDLRNKEIAKLMKLSEKTVASHLTRAHENLKKGLRQFTQ